MENQFIRTQMLVGKQGIEKLKNSTVAVFGVGGVGGYTVEALARSGVGTIVIIDNDTVSLSNINRQIIATHDTLGMLKTDAAEQRIKSINPDCTVIKHNCFFLPENADSFDFSKYDYVIDAIDTVSGKIELVMKAISEGTPIISSMGAGNKLDPTQFEVSDISKTSVCPLARVMRREMKKRGVNHLKVVCSKEQAITPFEVDEIKDEKDFARRRALPGSVAFVPSVAGLIIAGEVIKDLTK